MLINNKRSTKHGFHGWYQIQFLTRLDEKLKLRKYKKPSSPSKSSSGIKITLMSEPKFLYSLFQDDCNVSDESVKNTMTSLGIIRKKRKN